MKIQMDSSDAKTAKLIISGRVDATTYQDLQSAVNAVDKTVSAFEFDFRDVEYISSAGLRVLVTAGKKVGAENVSVTNVCSDVFDILHVTGYDRLFRVELAEEGSQTYISRSFKDILRMKAEQNPDVLFMVHAGESYSWLDIERCAQIVANDLFRLGVRRGTHVGLCSANSANWIITFFAIQKLGAIACLLNFNCTGKEIADISEAGDITHLCCGEIAAMNGPEGFPGCVTGAANSRITATYDIRSSISLKNRLNEYAGVEGLFDVKVESDDACVMIYTSGSTGKPKGVLLSAFNILNASAAMADSIMITGADKLCLILPLFHIFGLTAGLFSNALKNAPVIIPDNLRTGTILSAIDSFGCTLFHSVPTMVLALMNNKDFSSEKVLKLRCTILAGAPVTEAQVMKMNEIFPNTHFVCAYGLSEMAPVSMTKYNDTLEHIAKTVGLPVNNIRFNVVNPSTGANCAAGETGEITVEGYNLMSCYYKASLDLQSLDDTGCLHTGDLGFIDGEGYIHLTGRARELINRGGEKIMPNEVAEVISMYRGVADVKVLGIPDDFYGEVVGAGILMKDSLQLDREDLMAFLAQRLAKYKLPAYVFQCSAFPLLANGKVDIVNLRKEIIEKVALLKSKE